MGPLVISESGIGGQHGLIRPDRVRRAVGDLAPAPHDDETPRDAQDGLHVVIDDNERPPTAVELANPLEELVTKPRMNAGERLVEEQHRGLQHQAAPKLQQLLLAARQVLRRQPLDVGERQEVEVAPRAPDDLLGVVRHDAADPLAEPDPPHELGAPARGPGSLWGPVGAARRGAPRAPPTRRNGSHNGVSSPLRAKRMGSSNTMPKTGSRHWPYSRSHSSRNCTTNAPPTAVGRRSMPPITVMTTSLAISSRSPTLGVMMPMY